ncbi:MAG: LysM peptidoglycan-binding domain-containing protein, partial [Duncaniella sp.]|nr:LysM peptidoglycan-binding domain-containing protein [Duncaniella sp.]
MRFQGLKRFLALTVATGWALSSFAGVDKLPVKRINGRLYHYYEVEQKDNIYSILGKLDITREELRRNNPSVDEGLREGMTLYFPFKDEEGVEQAVSKSVPMTSIAPSSLPPVAAASTPEGSIRYEVTKGETIFGISRKFDIPTEELIQANPVLKDGLKAGQTIVIPKVGPKAQADIASLSNRQDETTVIRSEQTAEEPQQIVTEGYLVKKGETFYSIA